MKPRWTLTGKRFFHSAEKQGIQVMEVIDSMHIRQVVVWVIGRWAYQLNNEIRIGDTIRLLPRPSWMVKGGAQ
jgi:hypothetical protein